MDNLLKDVKCEFGFMMPLSDTTLKSYFNSKNPKCIFCGKELWDILIESLEGPEMRVGYHFFLLGCLPKIPAPEASWLVLIHIKELKQK